MSNLATPRPSRPSSPHPNRPSVVIPPSPLSTHNLSASALASLTCATPLTTTQSDSHTTSKPSNEQDTSESSAGIGISPDILAVGNLLSTMKSTLGALSATFDFLGEQTAKAAALGPAIEATHQIHVLRAQLSEQYAQQEARMTAIKAVAKNALSEQLSDQLRARMDAMIHETVAREVQQRVDHQLQVQIPQNLREQVVQHKRQILEVQTKIHNSEARRYNATLRSPSCLTEPLRPLLRPLPTPLQSPCAPAHATVPPTPAVPQPPAPTPTAWKAHPGSGAELGRPAPSPFFPRDLSSLFSLNSDAARALVREYGLVEDGDSADGSPECSGSEGDAEAEAAARAEQMPTPVSASGEEEDAGSDRERNLTRFMVHIGVPYTMAPVSNSTKRKRLAPLITTF